MANVPFFRLLGPTSEGIGVAGAVGLVLSGALPFVACLQKWLKKPLESLGKKTGMTEVGITGFLLSAANNMAMFATFDKMKEKEQILNVAFAVCAAFVIGDHLAFTAANAPEAIAPMMAAKLISGVVAVVIALLFYKPARRKRKNSLFTVCNKVKIKRPMSREMENMTRKEFELLYALKKHGMQSHRRLRELAGVSTGFISQTLRRLSGAGLDLRTGASPKRAWRPCCPTRWTTPSSWPPACPHALSRSAWKSPRACWWSRTRF